MAGPSSDDWLVLPPANKHGVLDEDIVHAIDHYLRVWEQEDGMTLFIGPDRVGRVLEVGAIAWFGLDAVVHAMPARDKYQ